ncbi:MAG: tRNA (N(6)-L-threonylcarbamoyladenosine(37)-C(2))-methylthiotransferase MtaB, partial [Alphaproteobacteria bacterium]
RIVVTGCAAQIEPETFAAMPEVDHVVGNSEKMQPETFRALTREGSARILVNDIMSVRETAHHLIAGFGSRARAYVQIQNGCDHRCTFCVIPYGRGPSRSVPAGEVVRQIAALVEEGYGEVVLTGVDITAYGADLPGAMSLGQLVRKILRLVPELRRLRLSSIDSVEADPDLLDAIAQEERLMPHLHLSLQAGDDMILKRMKRRHTRKDSVAFCAQVRSLRPDIVFGADLIAGFPTETAAMFENTLSLADACGLTHLHVFPFSPRKGTPAARMPQLERAVVKERARRLREKGAERTRRHLAAQTGRRAQLLMETGETGRTPDFSLVRLNETVAPGAIITATLTGHDATCLQGTLAR